MSGFPERYMSAEARGLLAGVTCENGTCRIDDEGDALPKLVRGQPPPDSLLAVWQDGVRRFQAVESAVAAADARAAQPAPVAVPAAATTTTTTRSVGFPMPTFDSNTFATIADKVLGFFKTDAQRQVDLARVKADATITAAELRAGQPVSLVRRAGTGGGVDFPIVPIVLGLGGVVVVSAVLKKVLR